MEKRILKFRCIKCNATFEGTSICKAKCSNCGYLHDCGEAELLNPKKEDGK